MRVFNIAETSGQAREAFTLTDLLVTLGVTAALLATASARARSGMDPRTTTCLFNLHRLMQGTIMYATDSRDSLPWPNWGNPNNIKGWLYTPTNHRAPDLWAEPYTNNPVLAYESGLVWWFVKDTNRYRCPLDTRLNPYFRTRDNKLSTYVMNGAVCAYGQIGVRSWRLSQFVPASFCFWEPSETIGDPPLGSFAYYDGSAHPSGNEGPGSVHPWGTPVATFAGSVERVTVKVFTEEQLAPGPNRVWCNPGTSNGH